MRCLHQRHMKREWGTLIDWQRHLTFKQKAEMTGMDMHVQEVTTLYVNGNVFVTAGKTLVRRIAKGFAGGRRLEDVWQEAQNVGFYGYAFVCPRWTNYWGIGILACFAIRSPTGVVTCITETSRERIPRRSEGHIYDRPIAQAVKRHILYIRHAMMRFIAVRCSEHVATHKTVIMKRVGRDAIGLPVIRRWKKKSFTMKSNITKSFFGREIGQRSGLGVLKNYSVQQPFCV